MVQIVLHPRTSSPTCGYCLTEAEKVWTCPKCGATLHPGCGYELGRCVTIGCALVPGLRGDQSAPRAPSPTISLEPRLDPTPEPEALPGWATALVCALLLVVGLGLLYGIVAGSYHLGVNMAQIAANETPTSPLAMGAGYLSSLTAVASTCLAFWTAWRS